MALPAVVHADAGPDDRRGGRRIREQFERALSNEEAIGRRFSTGALLIGIGVISIWLFIQVELSRVWYYQAILGAFGLLVLANYLLAQSRWDRPWRTYVFQACFLALLVAVIILPNPFVESWPIQTRLRFGNFVYVLLFLAPIALTFRPLAMIWAGLCAALAWAIGVAWVASRPESKTYWNPDSLTPMGSAEALTLFLDPHFVYVEGHIQDVVTVLLMAGVLALVVWRSRRLVLSQIGLARERANLARYFAPTVVDRLAQLDTPLGATRVQPVAVLFADIVGFTRFAEGSQPQTVVATLRAFHGRLERAIFDHGGTLDKFLGDGVMATFGTPNVGPHDARNALAAALDACAAIDELEQRAHGARRAADPGLDRHPLRAGGARRHRLGAPHGVRRAGRRGQRRAAPRRAHPAAGLPDRRERRFRRRAARAGRRRGGRAAGRLLRGRAPGAARSRAAGRRLDAAPARRLRPATDHGGKDMVRFGMHSSLWTARWTKDAVETLVPEAARHGLNVIEIALLAPETIDVEHSRAILAEHGIAPTCSLGLPQEVTAPLHPNKAEAYLMRALEVAHGLGSRHALGRHLCDHRLHLGRAAGRAGIRQHRQGAEAGRAPRRRATA